MSKMDIDKIQRRTLSISFISVCCLLILFHVEAFVEDASTRNIVYI